MTAAEILTGAEAVAAADAVVDDLIEAAKAGEDRARLTKAPAGAGKTGAVTRLANALADEDANVAVITQTNEQAFDLVGRIAEIAPGREISFLPAGGVELPADKRRANVSIVEAKKLGEATVIVATADKWAFSVAHLPDHRFDAGVVDEGYQMQSAKLLRIADLFPTLDFVGDPGQLDPFSTVDDSRWRGLPTNPVLNAVDALLAYHGDDVAVRSLPVTRRLPVSAADVIREVFYPDLQFGPGSEKRDRELKLGARTLRSKAIAQVWKTVTATGWGYLELPHRLVVQPDGEIVLAIAELVEALFASKPTIRDEKNGGRTIPLAQSRLAVGVAHRNQSAAVRIELQRRGLDKVTVDTANRLQGREFDVVVVWHPLAGRSDASAFHLDAGRAAVLTTRHRHACVVVGRAGAGQLLEDHAPPSEYEFGVTRQVEFDGWEAHARLLDHLETVKIPA
jgi:AAA domain